MKKSDIKDISAAIHIIKQGERQFLNASRAQNKIDQRIAKQALQNMLLNNVGLISTALSHYENSLLEKTSAVRTITTAVIPKETAVVSDESAVANSNAEEASDTVEGNTPELE